MLGLGLALSIGKRVLGDAIDSLLSALRGRATYYENGSASKSTIKAIDDADILDKASILLTPTAYSDALVHCVKDNTSDSDFDFDRASSATRINSDGLVQDMQSITDPELVTNGTFDTDSDWSATNSTINISNGVCQISSTSIFGYLNSTSSFETVVGGKYLYRFDCINRIGSGDVYMQVGTAQNGNNVANQNIGSIEDNTSYSIYFTATSTTSYLRIGFGGSGTSATIDNISIKDITFSEEVDLARINYDSNGENGHILLEPTSTNLIPYSEDFSAPNWSHKVSASIDPNVVVSPDGTQNASKLSFHQGSTTTRIEKEITSQTAGSYTFSVWAKSTTSENVQFEMEIGYASGGAEARTATSDWQRFEITGSVSSGTVNLYPQIEAYSSTNPPIYIWGAQFEKLPYATSYIPNHGTAVGVTRATETLTGSGNSTLINSTEGVLYFELSSFYDNANSLSINDGSSSKRITARVRPDISKIQLTVVGSTDDFNYNSATIDLSINNKIAIVYNNGDYYFYVNGVKSTVQSRGTFSANDFTSLDFNRGGGNEPFYGKCKSLAVFNEALSDTELTNLTS